jgi:hypothetical protein
MYVDYFHMTLRLRLMLLVNLDARDRKSLDELRASATALFIS